MSEESFDETFLKLKVIANIRVNECLYTQNGEMSTSPPWAFQSVLRRWLQESRGKNFSSIERTVNAAFRILANGIDRERAVSTGTSKEPEREDMAILEEDEEPVSPEAGLSEENINLERLRNLQILCRTQCYLKEARPGIGRFMTTYRDDTNMQARGTLLLDTMTDKLVQTEHVLRSLGLDRPTLDRLLKKREMVEEDSRFRKRIRKVSAEAVLALDPDHRESHYEV